MDHSRERRRSHLFTVRLWQEQGAGGDEEWRGKVQHVASGEFRYFRGWASLADRLPELLPQRETGDKRDAEESAPAEEYAP